MPIFRLMASIGLDDSGFQAGLKRVESGAAGIATKLAGAFASGAAIAAVASWTTQIANAAEAVQDLSEQLGISTNEAQSLQRASARSGIEVGKYADMLIKLKKARAEALSGNTTVQGQFRTLGLNPSQSEFDLLRGMGGASSPEQLVAVFDLVGAKAGKALNSLKEIRELSPIEMISSENAKLISGVKDDLGDIVTTLMAIGGNVLGDRLREVMVMAGFLERVAFGQHGPRNKSSSFQPTMAGENQTEEEGMLAMNRMNALGANPEAVKTRNQMRFSRQAFAALPTEELARIGGSFGPGTDAQSLEREQLTVQRKMEQRLGVIEDKITSVPTGGVE